MSTLLAENKVTVHLELRKADASICLSIQLGEEFTGGPIVRLAPDARFAVEGMDELSSAYGPSNWLSGLASGVFYAFRALEVVRRVVYVSEFTGRLRSSDMTAVAEVATCAIARCLHRDVPPAELEGWQIQTGAVPQNGKPDGASTM